jgi:hypothetical protein
VAGQYRRTGPSQNNSHSIFDRNLEVLLWVPRTEARQAWYANVLLGRERTKAQRPPIDECIQPNLLVRILALIEQYEESGEAKLSIAQPSSLLAGSSRRLNNLPHEPCMRSEEENLANNTAGTTDHLMRLLSTSSRMHRVKTNRQTLPAADDSVC